ncbi:MAG: hypothetical protein ABI461_09300 [Polyangiaceae bacterium]
MALGLAMPGIAQAAPPRAAAHETHESPVVIWPALTPVGDQGAVAAVHRPLQTEAVFDRAQELDATLRDGAQDLGYALRVSDAGPAAGHMRDQDLIDRAAQGDVDATAGTWVVSPRVEYAGNDDYVVRLVAVPPKGRELRVRVETVKGPDVAARGLVMLRDLLSPSTAAQASASEAQRERVDDQAGQGVMMPIRSQGRALLAINGALFGAYVAFSIQRASGSDDPRVLYPLLALGTGGGLGAALLVADDWDISTGDAWVLSGAAWWGAGSGVLLANGLNVGPLTDRYAWGVGAGLGGLALGTFALTRSKMDEGDAVLVNSGAALGFALGGASELFYRGTTNTSEVTPYTGSGLGAAIGLVGGGTLASFVTVSPSRALLIDLGTGLGGLAGAAAASPLVFENLNPGKSRGFIAITGGTALLGGGLAWLLTRSSDHEKPKPSPPVSSAHVVPFGGVVGASATPNGQVPAYGGGIRGDF